jgi:hypothetical protein
MEAMVEGREAHRAERVKKGGDQSDSGAMDNSAQSIEGPEVMVESSQAAAKFGTGFF